MLSKGVHFPPRQGPSSEGIRYGLGGSLVRRGSRAPLCPQVTKTDVVEAATHTKPPAIVLRGIVADDLVAAVPLPPPPGFDCSIPLEPWATVSEGPSQASSTRARQGFEGVSGPSVICHSCTGHTPEALRAVWCNEVGPPSPHLPGLQGG